VEAILGQGPRPSVAAERNALPWAGIIGVRPAGRCGANLATPGRSDAEPQAPRTLSPLPSTLHSTRVGSEATHRLSSHRRLVEPPQGILGAQTSRGGPGGPDRPIGPRTAGPEGGGDRSRRDRYSGRDGCRSRPRAGSLSRARCPAELGHVADDGGIASEGPAV
jgi:hypothetical protein